MPRTIEIEELEVRSWTCPKCGGHWPTWPSKEAIRCGDRPNTGCGSEFPASEYNSHSVLAGTQCDLVGAAYKLLMEEAKLHGAECMVLGALPGNVQVFAMRTVEEMIRVPFQWAHLGLESAEKAK